MQSYFLSSQLPIVLLILFLLTCMGGLVFPQRSLTTAWDRLRLHPALLAAWVGGESLVLLLAPTSCVTFTNSNALESVSHTPKGEDVISLTAGLLDR